ncbi:MAG: ChbG/HpnK family deacetylase [Hymenobacter sp.]
MMANFASDADLRALQKLASPTLSVGLHLTLNAGQPLSAATAVPSLVDKNGQFYPSSQLWQRYLRGQVRRAELTTEIAAQLRRLAAAGLPPRTPTATSTCTSTRCWARRCSAFCAS